MGGDTSPHSLQEKVVFYRAKIKEWEGEYIASNGTRPDKEALGSAPDDIKAAYKSYYRSRKQLEKGESAQQKENSFEKENIVIDNNIISNEDKNTDMKCESENKSDTKNIQGGSNFRKEDHIVDIQDSRDISHCRLGSDIAVVEEKIDENEDVWGCKFNKNNNNQFQNKKSFSFDSDSLYSKMAEKMRNIGTVKVRTSLKKRSSICSLKRLNSLKKPSNSPALSRSFSLPFESKFESDSIEGSLEMFPDESGATNVCVSQENKVQKDNLMCDDKEKDVSLLSTENQNKSIFECIEKEDKTKAVQNAINFENDSPDASKASIPFKVKRNPFTLKSQTQIVSAVAVSNNLSQLFTKNKNIDRAWLARTTNDLVDEELQSGPIIPAKDWKMKLVEKEWNEDENIEDMDTEDGIKLNIEHKEQTKSKIKKETTEGISLDMEHKIQTKFLNKIKKDEEKGIKKNNVSSSINAVLSSINKQILEDELEVNENKSTDDNASMINEEEEELLDMLCPQILLSEASYSIEKDELLDTSDISEADESIQERRKERKSCLPYMPDDMIDSVNNPENLNVEIRISERNTIRKNLCEIDSEDESEQLRKKLNETSDQSGKRFELSGPLSDESEDEWKPEKVKKNELVNDDSEEEIEEGSKEWEENASASRGKKRRAQTLDELEDTGAIQSSWPAPKKRRTTLNPKKGRTALKWKAEQVAHDIEAASPKVNKTKGRKKREINSESSPRVNRKKVLAKTKISDKLHERNMENIARHSIKATKYTDQVVARQSIKKTKKTDNVGVTEISNQKVGLQDSVQKSTELAVGYNEQDDIDTHGVKTSVSNKTIITKEERFAKKVKSGTANQNFIKINLKKKTFVRGKKTLTGEKYRRAEWKKKQIQKSAEEGNASAIKTLTCFKCGDFGHWSKYCPGKSDKLQSIDQYDENESTFLSLEDASNMALGIKPSNTTSNTYDSGNSHSWFGGSKDSEKNNEEQTPSNKIEDSKNLDVGNVKNNENKELLNSEIPEDDDLFDDENMEVENNHTIVNDEEIPLEILQEMEDEEIPDEVLQAMEDDANTEKKKSTKVASVPPSNITSSQSYYEPRPTVEPLYNLLENGEVGPTTDEVKETLEMFGYSSFREGQETAIMRVLSGLNTLLILSTGSGKSLCYQLPAYLYAKYNNCITLCVSPLVSLMEDQVTGLPHFLNAVCLHHHQSATVRSKALTALQSGDAHILLVSPEAVVASRSGGVLGTLLKELPAIAFACLDEAHCVSEWSHNFRPSYLRVCQVMREKLGIKTILGLTATARHTTAISIGRHLQVSEQQAGGVIRGTGVRENLLLSVSRDEIREQALLELLMADRFANCSSIIIYCTRRDLCERIATLIRSQLLEPSKVDLKSNMKRTRGVSFDAEAYHAGLSGSRRNTIQKRFMSGKLRIVVATVAFGMGIDKADLRGVIHFNMPKNVESYVQEIGRAGRDGQIAHCHLFLDAQDGGDTQELKRHIYSNSIDRHTVRKLLNKTFQPCACAKLRNLETSKDKPPSTPTKDDPNIFKEPETSSQNTDNETQEEADSKAEDEDKKSNKECIIASAPGMGKSSISPSSCPRHEVAIPMEKLIEDLDLPEENLQTLLCYLELQPGALIQLKHHVYSSASVQCYGGPKQLCAVSRRCPPLAVALALQRQEGKTHESTNTAIFPVIEVSAKMGWNSGIVKRELKNLEWYNGKRSGVSVEFSDLAFNMFVRGDLTEDEQDQLLDDLYERAMTQERDQLRQLQYTYQTLRAVSHNSILLCCDEVDMERCDRLRNELIDYFSEGGGKLNSVVLEEQVYISPALEMGVRSSVRALISVHADMPWTGRAVARVFHGIGSPNFPVMTWGRVRRFWRCHLNVDFKIVVKLATQEIIRCR